MISFKDNIFHLDTVNTSYVFKITKFGHLQSIYYGRKISHLDDYDALIEKNSIIYGSSVLYSKDDPLYCLDHIPQEYTTVGKGDYRATAIEIKMPDKSYICDFTYDTHNIIDGILPIKTSKMPQAIGQNDVKTLEITMSDKVSSVELKLIYTIFYETDVITRRAILINNNSEPLYIRKIMSFNLDMACGDQYQMSTFDGSWIKERTKHTRQLTCGQFINSSITGNSSNRHNPLVILSENETDQNNGSCYGFNLVYSGNHYTLVEVSPHNQLRIMSGINPHCFEWELNNGDIFETPEAVLSYSDKGFNGLSNNMHNFIREHIVRGYWAKKERPILINSWEAMYMDFNHHKLLNLAKTAAKLGIELFVLDDGWFGKRDSDQSSLGDWFENTHKLKKGLKGLASSINKLGMMFGLWFEPEMVNQKSDLYTLHPDWAIKAPNRTPLEGRNQYVLDLCKKEVREYIIKAVSDVLKSANIEYVKWDMNRNITDMYSYAISNQGEFFHRYILGLYEILDCITSSFPKVLFESCASGGNRFDLGMLCFMPQIWTSDNTDGFSRLSIQEGTSYGYPVNTMGAHIGSYPSHQTLRKVPLETRFNVSSFGTLGYEINLNALSPIELKTIKKQIDYYKQHRALLQFGDFYRLDDIFEDMAGGTAWMIINKERTEAIIGQFEGVVKPNQQSRTLKAMHIKDGIYVIETRQQSINIKLFGDLINHVSPIKIKGDGILHNFLGNHFDIKSEEEKYIADASAINLGKVQLKQNFVGTGYNKEIKLLTDFDSRLYHIKLRA
ncbi:MAG TPA: alpha-galactosidase [Clostridia bacterium]